MTQSTEMQTAATWGDELWMDRAAGESSSVKRVVLLASLILALNLSATAWMYFEGTNSLALVSGSGRVASDQRASRTNTRLLTEFDFWTLRLLIWTSTGGAGFLLVIVLGMSSWQTTWTDRLRAMKEECQKTAGRLELQTAVSRKSEYQLQELKAAAEQRASQAESVTARLQAELDQLKKAEKNLAQQRQELESSKTVLELHVQTRSRELQKLQRRYELILNSAGEGICGLDLENRTTFANPAVAKITGWPVEELIGKQESELFHGAGAKDQAPAKIQEAGEQVFCRKDGSSFPVEIIKTPIDENGRMVGSVLVFKDISERKQVEDRLAAKAAELARSNSELEQFAFVASHDLQEPLRKIQSFGDRLRSKCEAAIAPEAHQYLDRMQNAAARMRTLIDDLLAFSRVIRSSEPFVPVDLGMIVKEVLSDLEVRIERTHAKIELGTLHTVEADPMQMRQLLLNLIGNALKFQPPNAQPSVKITSRTFTTLSGDELCELSIEDNGIGFDEKYLEKIFAVFQRLHGRNEYEGTGVGLAVCRRITDRHHGTITARSQLGKGATFIVAMPVHQVKTKSLNE
jgi:PAS domain S-box-containing protein